MGTIVYRDGKAYAVVVDNLLSEPTKVTAYYPLANVPPEGAQTCAYRIGSGGYNVFLEGRRIGFYCLVNGDGTLPTWTEEEPILCPKVRKDTKTRWNGYQGRWEKLSKRQGWLAA